MLLIIEGTKRDGLHIKYEVKMSRPKSEKLIARIRRIITKVCISSTERII